MRSPTTTRELAALLARPAFRALESVAKHLDVRLPEASGQESSEAREASAPAPSVSGPEEAAASSPRPPVPTSAEASHTQPVAAETAMSVSITPPPGARAERQSEFPPSLEQTGSTGQAPPSEMRALDGSSSAPLVAPVGTPHAGNAPEAPRAGTSGAPAPPLQEKRGYASPSPEPLPGSPGSATALNGARAPGRHLVRLLPLSEPGARPPPDGSRVERTSPPSGEEQAPRPTRQLTFLPDPAATAPPAPARPPVPVTASLAGQVSSAMAPALERAHQLTRATLPPERSTSPQSAAAPPGEAVRNTFNVNVHLDPSGAPSGVDRRALEEALVDILRDTARRHGLEV